MNKIFSIKENLKESIPLMSLLSAVNLIMMILITYLPITGVVVVFLLPLPSIICTLFIKSRYYVIYALTSLIISIIFCIGDFSSVLFTLIPVLISSFVYAFLIKCNLGVLNSLVLTAFILTFINLLELFIFNYFFNINFIEIICNLLNIQNVEYLNNSIPTFVYLYSLLQGLMMLITTYDQVKKFYIENFYYKTCSIVQISFLSLTILLTVILYFFNLSYFYLFLLVSGTSSLFFYTTKRIDRWKILLFTIFVVITWIIYVLFIKLFPIERSFILLLVLPILILAYKSIDLACKIKQKKV